MYIKFGIIKTNMLNNININIVFINLLNLIKNNVCDFKIKK